MSLKSHNIEVYIPWPCFQPCLLLLNFIFTIDLSDTFVRYVHLDYAKILLSGKHLVNKCTFKFRILFFNQTLSVIIKIVIHLIGHRSNQNINTTERLRLGRRVIFIAFGLIILHYTTVEWVNLNKKILKNTWSSIGRIVWLSTLYDSWYRTQKWKTAGFVQASCHRVIVW